MNVELKLSMPSKTELRYLKRKIRRITVFKNGDGAYRIERVWGASFRLIEEMFQDYSPIELGHLIKGFPEAGARHDRDLTFDGAKEIYNRWKNASIRAGLNQSFQYET